jgi:hypothetical protein
VEKFGLSSRQGPEAFTEGLPISSRVRARTAVREGDGPGFAGERFASSVMISVSYPRGAVMSMFADVVRERRDDASMINACAQMVEANVLPALSERRDLSRDSG